jgi:glycosyltransferase involved in cell wall biosynthesis
MMFSIVIPAYNREWCIERALISADNFLQCIGEGEIVIVNDGSTDGTVNQVLLFIKENTSDNIVFRVVDNKINKGVCAAKNSGAYDSSGDWIIFLDSDDELIHDNIEEFVNMINNNKSCPVHFFASIDEAGTVIGDKPECSIKRDMNQLLLYGTSGESLPVLNRMVFLECPYDEELNGFEGLAYLRIALQYDYAMIHATILRKYHTDHEDRLSSIKGIRKRSNSLVKGYCKMLRELYPGFYLRSYTYVISRCIYHAIRYFIYLIMKR